MPFVRFSRDKRGYEYIYLIHVPLGNAGRGGSAARPRVLYWYRTPPGVKVGREPFDPPLREALEAQHPDLTFDWKKILEAQAPPPVEVEPWRERRRAERSAKQARSASRGDEPAVDRQPAAVAITIADEGSEEGDSDRPREGVSPAEGGEASGRPPQPTGRRRRRGGRNRRGATEAAAVPSSADLAPGVPPVSFETPPLTSQPEQTSLPDSSVKSQPADGQPNETTTPIQSS